MPRGTPGMKFLKFLLALLLLPLVPATVMALARLLAETAPGSLFALPAEAWWGLGGFILWIILFLALPRPVTAYVLAHELTHAVWAWLLGARVSRLRVSSRGGSVCVSHSNWIITLAPYFFPFYTCLVLLAHALVGLWADTSPYTALWLALVGFTLAFHVTFTIEALSRTQPDVLEHGRLFSYTVIALINLAGAGCWICAVAPPRLGRFATLIASEAGSLYRWIWSAWALGGT